MHYKLTDLTIYLLVEIRLELLVWRIVVHFHGQVVGVFLLHKLEKMRLNLANNISFLFH